LLTPEIVERGDVAVLQSVALEFGNS